MLDDQFPIYGPPPVIRPVTNYRPPTGWRFIDMLLIGTGLIFCLLIAYPVLGRATDRLVDNENNPLLDVFVEVNAAFWVYMMVFMVALGLGLLLGKTWSDFGFRLPAKDGWAWVGAAIVTGVVMIPVRLALIIMLMLIFEPSALLNQEDSGLDGDFSGLFLITAIQGVIMVVIFAPLVEEFIFRGILQPWVRGRLGVILSVLVSGFLFGLAHQQKYMVISNTIMGFVLAGFYERSGSLWIPMLIHFVNNSLVVLLVVVLAVFAALLGGA